MEGGEHQVSPQKLLSGKWRKNRFSDPITNAKDWHPSDVQKLLFQLDKII